MTTLIIFDPAMCCSTGVCGPRVDQHIVDFAADLDWLKGQGTQVRRINLGQEPAEFVANPDIKALLETGGETSLPAILRDGALVSHGRYPSRAELAGWAGVAQVAADAKPDAPSACC